MNDALRQQLQTELVKSGFASAKLESLEALHHLLSIGGGNINRFALLQAVIKGKLFSTQPHMLDANVSYSAALIGMSKPKVYAEQANRTASTDDGVMTCLVFELPRAIISFEARVFFIQASASSTFASPIEAVTVATKVPNSVSCRPGFPKQMLN